MEVNNYLVNKDLIKRAISSFILILAALLLNHMGGYYFFLAVILASIVLLLEYYRLFNLNVFNLKFLTHVSFGLISLCFIYFSYYHYFFYTILLGILFLLYLIKKNYFFVLTSYFYFYLPLGALLFLNSYAEGKLVIYWIFIVVWSVDISGFIFGKIFKGPKLVPNISPNKTWSGFVSGIFFAGFFSFLYAYYLEYNQLLAKYFILGLLGGIVSTAGDIFESKLKRINKKKDTSRLIPGHGGLLDRLDGFLFAILFFWMLSFA